MNELTHAADPKPIKIKRSSTNWPEIIATFSAMLMYFAWIVVFRLLVDKESAQENIVVFLIVLTQFFMSWVPKLREKPLTFKVVALQWLLLPVIYMAVMAAVMAGIHNLIGPLLDRVFP